MNTGDAEYPNFIARRYSVNEAYVRIGLVILISCFCEQRGDQPILQVKVQLLQ